MTAELRSRIARWRTPALFAALVAVVTAGAGSRSGARAPTSPARDRLQAELSARAALSVARLLLASEPAVRAAIAPAHLALTGGAPAQLELAPVADAVARATLGPNVAVKLTVVAANGLVGVNAPLFFGGDSARLGVAVQLFALMGGYLPDSGPLPSGSTTRVDLVEAVLDWWDEDRSQTVFDPGRAAVNVAGMEPGEIPGAPVMRKNAPYDTLEELRLLEGFGPAFYSAVVQPDADDLSTRRATIYGSGATNPNRAPPEALLARACGPVREQPLCQDPIQAAAFIEFLRTLRQVAPTPLFATPGDVVDLLTGSERAAGLIATTRSFLDPDSPLLAWTPLALTDEQRMQLQRSFVTTSAIFLIQADAGAGGAQARVLATLNLDPSWVPFGELGLGERFWPLGVLHYYRLER